MQKSFNLYCNSLLCSHFHFHLTSLFLNGFLFCNCGFIYFLQFFFFFTWKCVYLQSRWLEKKNKHVKCICKLWWSELLVLAVEAIKWNEKLPNASVEWLSQWRRFSLQIAFEKVLDTWFVSFFLHIILGPRVQLCTVTVTKMVMGLFMEKWIIAWLISVSTFFFIWYFCMYLQKSMSHLSNWPWRHRQDKRCRCN